MELQDLGRINGRHNIFGNNRTSLDPIPEFNSALPGARRRSPHRRSSLPTNTRTCAASADASSIHSSPPHTASVSSSNNQYQLPPWSDEGIDVEPGCGTWDDLRQYERLPFRSAWYWPRLFGSALDDKARNPAACSSINYKIKKGSSLTCFAWGFLISFAYCIIIALFHKPLGLRCTGPPPTPVTSGPQPIPQSSLFLAWAATVIEAAVFFILAQGYFGMRSARERMERVKQTTITLAYSFLKTTNAKSPIGYTQEDLQLIIYECLALLTAFPVCLLQQIYGNSCEPAITRYCQEVAKVLKRLREGDTEAQHGLSSMRPGSFDLAEGRQQFAKVDYFFEVFSLQLQREYEKQPMRTKLPSMALYQIIYNLRNHFENMVDLGNLDDRRTPIVRENIDMLSLAGRESGIFAWGDVTPSVFLRLITVCCFILVFATPYQKCDWLVNTTNPALDHQAPAIWVILTAGVLSIIGATMLCLLDEMWRMWDPFRRGINPFAFTLGIAMEIDNMLNEFYEEDTTRIIRKHAYVGPAAYDDIQEMEDMQSSLSRSNDSGLRPLTV